MIGFECDDDLVVALVELLPGDVLQIICPDHMGIGDAVCPFIEYNKRTFSGAITRLTIGLLEVHLIIEIAGFNSHPNWDVNRISRFVDPDYILTFQAGPQCREGRYWPSPC